MDRILQSIGSNVGTNFTLIDPSVLLNFKDPNEFFQFLLNKYTYAEIGMAFNKSGSLMEKIILCYANKIEFITFFDGEPQVSSVMKHLVSTILIICFFASFFGNFSIIMILFPFKNIFARFKNKYIVSAQTIQSNQSTNHQEPNVKSCTSELFVFSSSIFDFLFTIAILPFHVVTLLNDSHWIFGEIACKLHFYITNLVLCITSIIIVTISLERYYSIVQKNSPISVNVSCCLVDRILLGCRLRQTSRSSSSKYVAILLVAYWTASLGIVIPYFLNTRHLAIILSTVDPRGGCWDMTDYYWCYNVWSNTQAESIYKMFYWSIVFILPGIVLIYSYGRISWYLFVRKPVGNGNSADWRVKSKRRVIKILICDCLFYVLCWYPYSIWSVILSLNGLLNFIEDNYDLNQLFTINIYLYSIALLNVTLKWIIRIYSSRSRIQIKFINYLRRLSRFGFRLNTTQTVRPMTQNCSAVPPTRPKNLIFVIPASDQSPSTKEF